MTFVHPTADVEAGAVIGEGTRVWSNSQVRVGAEIGPLCNIGRNVFIDIDVHVGANVKIHSF